MPSPILTLLDQNTSDLGLWRSVEDDVDILKSFGSFLELLEPRVIILDRRVSVRIVVKPEMPMQNKTQTVREELIVSCQGDAQSLIERLGGESLTVLAQLMRPNSHQDGQNHDALL